MAHFEYFQDEINKISLLQDSDNGTEQRLLQTNHT